MERAIMFSPAMVRAILEGRKTQTRRIVKNAHVITRDDKTGATDTRCPYGSPGDRLWVRETWRSAWHDELFCTVQYAADLSYRKPRFDDEDVGHRFSYMCEVCAGEDEPWRSPLHMWREMSRLSLEVTDVRVERLQKITEADAIAEGVQTERDHYGGDVPLKVHGSVAWHRYDEHACSAVSAVESYRTLWESINGKGSWDVNPWVWVVEFKVQEVRQ